MEMLADAALVYAKLVGDTKVMISLGQEVQCDGQSLFGRRGICSAQRIQSDVTLQQEA